MLVVSLPCLVSVTSLCLYVIRSVITSLGHSTRSVDKLSMVDGTLGDVARLSVSLLEHNKSIPNLTRRSNLTRGGKLDVHVEATRYSVLYDRIVLYSKYALCIDLLRWPCMLCVA